MNLLINIKEGGNITVTELDEGEECIYKESLKKIKAIMQRPIKYRLIYDEINELLNCIEL